MDTAIGASVPAKRRMGRPTKYRPAYCDQLIQYFTQPFYTEDASGNRRANPPKLLKLFAYDIGVDIETLENWGKAHPEFFVAITKAKAMQEAHLIACGFVGTSNPAVTIFLLKNNHGYKDRLDLNGNGKLGDTHYHLTQIQVNANSQELASGILTRLSRRTPLAADSV